jgi:hypothetical protein
MRYDVLSIVTDLTSNTMKIIKSKTNKRDRVFVNPVQRQQQPNLGNTNPGRNPL